MGTFPGGGVAGQLTTDLLVENMDSFGLIVDAGDIAYAYGYQVENWLIFL